MNNAKLICIIAALIIGTIGVSVGALEAFIVLLITGVGWLIGKYAAGELGQIDVFLARLFSNRLGPPRD